jgi:hypothetical protein
MDRPPDAAREPCPRFARHHLGATPMCSFSCPNFDMEREHCLRLQAECVPGRPGCVLRANSVFAVPWEERLRERQLQRETEQPSRENRRSQGRSE